MRHVDPIEIGVAGLAREQVFFGFDVAASPDVLVECTFVDGELVDFAVHEDDLPARAM